MTIHRQEATKKSYQDRIENKTAENKDLRSLLNETYNLQVFVLSRFSSFYHIHIDAKFNLPLLKNSELDKCTLQDEPATRLSYNETPERLNTRSPDMKNRLVILIQKYGIIFVSIIMDFAIRSLSQGPR